MEPEGILALWKSQQKMRLQFVKKTSMQILPKKFDIASTPV